MTSSLDITWPQFIEAASYSAIIFSSFDAKSFSLWLFLSLDLHLHVLLLWFTFPNYLSTSPEDWKCHGNDGERPFYCQESIIAFQYFFQEKTKRTLKVNKRGDGVWKMTFLSSDRPSVIGGPCKYLYACTIRQRPSWNYCPSKNTWSYQSSKLGAFYFIIGMIVWHSKFHRHSIGSRTTNLASVASFFWSICFSRINTVYTQPTKTMPILLPLELAICRHHS